jgi:predicted ATPase/DNA-binding SARP family transcriptional activator
MPETDATVDTTAPLTITLFGPLSVLVDGKPLTLRSRKAQWLLALLALRHGRPVEREWLARTLWPDFDQTQAYANLRPTLSELRKALGSEGERIQAPNRHSLLMDLTDAEVDILRFDAAIARKTPAGLQQAVALYRGPLLEGIAEDWVAQDREVRAHACLRALHTLAETAVTAGEHATAIGHWHRAIVLDPLGEAARRGLMTSFAATGDINAALEVYREFATSLREDDPRATPSEETTALYRQLRERARQEAAATETAPVTPQVSGYLPHALTELVGRDDERLEVAEALHRSRLVTLTGPGGIGKTRLALAVVGEVVQEFPDGVWLTSLEALPTPLEGPPARGEDTREEGTRQILQQVASVLQIKESSRQPLLSLVTDYLRRKRLLLVLDNCEHLLEASAWVAAHLLRECPGVRILVTSREALRVDGEMTWVVPSLAAPDPGHLPVSGSALVRSLAGYDAVRLFAERAETVNRSFALTGGNARDVALLCSRLEGIPLALELAAARSSVLTPAAILVQLDARPLDVLTSRVRDIAPRHRSLRATLEWSFGLLPPEAQSFLADLGVFRGGWTREAAQAVCPDVNTLELLTMLQEASLVNREDRGEVTRFSLLETVRQFAVEALERSGRAGEVRRRHARYYLGWLREAVDSPDFLALTRQEYANIGAAFRWASESGEAETAVSLCHNIAQLWLHTGQLGECRHWLEITARQIAAMPSPINPDEAVERASIRNTYKLIQVQFFYIIGDHEAAAKINYELFEEALRAGKPLERRTEIFNAALFRTSIDLNWALTMLVRHSLPLEREYSSDGRANPIVLSQLALVARLAGQSEIAASYLAEALDLCRGREESNPDGYIRTLSFAGRAALSEGDLTLAQERFGMCLSVARQRGDMYMSALALCSLAALAHERGETELEQEYLSEAIDAAGAEPTISVELVFCRRRAELLLAQRDPEGAIALIIEKLRLLRGKALSFRLYVHPLLLLLADAELSARPAEPHQTAHAARLLGAAEGVATRLGLLAPERVDRERAAHLWATLSKRLGSERLAEEEAIGTALDDEAALEFALTTG